MLNELLVSSSSEGTEEIRHWPPTFCSPRRHRRGGRTAGRRRRRQGVVAVSEQARLHGAVDRHRDRRRILRRRQVRRFPWGRAGFVDNRRPGRVPTLLCWRQVLLHDPGVAAVARGGAEEALDDFLRRPVGAWRLWLDLHVGLVLRGRPLGHRVGEHRPAGRHRHAPGHRQRGEDGREHGEDRPGRGRPGRRRPGRRRPGRRQPRQGGPRTGPLPASRQNWWRSLPRRARVAVASPRRAGPRPSAG